LKNIQDNNIKKFNVHYDFLLRSLEKD